MSENTTTFKIETDYYDNDEKIYAKSQVTFKSGVTVLVGCNGSGKSTLIKQIYRECEKGNIPCFKFDNLLEGGDKARSKAAFFGNMNFVAQTLCASEGENINQNIGECARNIGAFVHKNSSAKKLFILFDAIDSGLSIDNVIETKEYLFKTIVNDCRAKNIDAYIIVSANEYEMAKDEQCLTIPNLTYREFKTYNSFRKFIIASRNKKNKRYKWDTFEFE